MGDSFILSLSFGVVFPHKPLQLGKFADDFGEQIRLAQPRRAFGLLHIRPDQRRQLAGQSFNPFNALGLGAQLLVKDDVLEFRQAIFKSGL